MPVASLALNEPETLLLYFLMILIYVLGSFTVHKLISSNFQTKRTTIVKDEKKLRKFDSGFGIIHGKGIDGKGRTIVPAKVIGNDPGLFSLLHY